MLELSMVSNSSISVNTSRGRLAEECPLDRSMRLARNISEIIPAYRDVRVPLRVLDNIGERTFAVDIREKPNLNRCIRTANGF